MAEKLDAARLASLLKHDCRLAVLESTTTTNDEVLAFARRSGCGGRVRMGGVSVTQPFVAVSAEQTAGRGRLGRVWSSPLGGVYLSVLLELDAALAQARASTIPLPRRGGTGEAGDGVVQSALGQSLQASLSPLAALAVRGALQTFATDDLRIKWPNDVISERGKLVGILVELKRGSAVFPYASSHAQYAVVGIGVNVNRPDGEAVEGAAYLSDGKRGGLSLEEAAAASINGLLTRYETWRAAGCSFAPFTAEYHEHMALLGQWACVRNAAGDEIASGIVQGIDDDARFILMGEQGQMAIAAGEVTLRNR
jgi:BirA family biotin operon repressor/biotin-[acetyl-CoA-carboxylase] ligase